MREWIADILYVLIAYVLLNAIFEPQPLQIFFGNIVHHITIFILAGVIGLCVAMFSLRKEITLLIRHKKKLNPSIKGPIYHDFLLPHLRRQMESAQRLSTSEGVLMDKKETQEFVSKCFERCKESYQGTDSHPPTEFYKLYPWYVSQQNARKNGGPSNDTRILLVTEDDLKNDYNNDKLVFETFFETHLINDINLLQVDPSIAKKLSKQNDLPSTDLGIFGWKFVVFFSPEVHNNEDYNRIWLHPLTGDLYERVKSYLFMLNRYARKIDVENRGPELKDRSPDQVEMGRRRIFSKK